MRRGTFAQLRVLTLLVAFGIGLLGQAAAAVAMPMQMPQDASNVVVLGGSADGSGTCNGCAQQQGVPTAPAMGANCMFALCSTPPALLPSSGPIVAPSIREGIQPVAVRVDTGITIRPDLGPPRSIHRS